MAFDLARCRNRAVTAPRLQRRVCPSHHAGRGQCGSRGTGNREGADVKVADKATEGVEAVSSPAKPEPPVLWRIVRTTRAGTAQAPLPLCRMVAPVGDPVRISCALPMLLCPPSGAGAPTPTVQVQIMQALFLAEPHRVRLMPEELGHVRIDMRHEGDRLVMSVSAERQDTLNLLRRHAGELAADAGGGHSGWTSASGAGPGRGRKRGPVRRRSRHDAPGPCGRLRAAACAGGRIYPTAHKRALPSYLRHP